MIKPPHKSDLADRVATQSLQLLKAHTDLQFSRLSSVQPQTIGTAASASNQSVSHLLAKILPNLLSTLNQTPLETINKAKIDQVVLDYRFTNLQNTHSLKSTYLADKIMKYLPLILKLPSLQLPLFQASEEGPSLQPNVTTASFPFPNAPISSEYFKYFELFQRSRLTSQKSTRKKKRRPLKRKQS